MSATHLVQNNRLFITEIKFNGKNKYSIEMISFNKMLFFVDQAMDQNQTSLFQLKKMLSSQVFLMINKNF